MDHEASVGLEAAARGARSPRDGEGWGRRQAANAWAARDPDGAPAAARTRAERRRDRRRRQRWWRWQRWRRWQRWLDGERAAGAAAGATGGKRPAAARPGLAGGDGPRWIGGATGYVAAPRVRPAGEAPVYSGMS
jgi:hypothetical protein